MNEECYLKDKKLPLLTGGVYFEASARENHEGVHAAFLHLCQEVRIGGFLIRFELCVCPHTKRNSCFPPMSQKDVRMHFEHTKLSGISTSCGNLDYRLFPTDLDGPQHKYKNTCVVLSFRWSERWEGETGRKEEEASTWPDPNLPTCRSWRGGSGRSCPPKSSQPQRSDCRTRPKTSRSWTCDKTTSASMEIKIFPSFLKKGLYMEDLWLLLLGNRAINGMKRHGRPSLSIQSVIKIRSSHQMDRQRLNSALWLVNLFCFLDWAQCQHELLPGNEDAALSEYVNYLAEIPLTAPVSVFLKLKTHQVHHEMPF